MISSPCVHVKHNTHPSLSAFWSAGMSHMWQSKLLHPFESRCKEREWNDCSLFLDVAVCVAFVPHLIYALPFPISRSLLDISSLSYTSLSGLVIVVVVFCLVC